MPTQGVKDATAMAWKCVTCPTCGAAAGESCGRVPVGVPWGWVRTAPHVARKRAVLALRGREEE